MNSGLAVIVLAAGKGTRMRSALPKVLHPVAGVPMAAWVLAAARSLEPERIIVVVGHEADAVRAALGGDSVTFVDQPELLGTADAVARCREAAAGCETVMVLNGDSPLITGETIARLFEARGKAPLAFLACEVPDSGAFGRVERDASGTVTGIREARDGAGPGSVAERNAGQYLFAAGWLWERLAAVPRQANGEYYLTDLVAAAYREETPALAIRGSAEELMGFDDRVGLAEAERLMRQRILRAHMLNGVTIVDPATTYIDGSVEIEADVTILQNCWLSGATRVATGTTIGPGTTLKDSRVGARCRVAQSVIEDSELEDGVQAGPFAHVRGRSVIGEGCFLGNYAEVNRSRLGRGVKMHHFSYLGDATVGDRANIAAGVITCNYDGEHKHPTVIGEGAFVGCDTMLVAPVTMGAGAITGAGTVLNRDLEPEQKAVGVPARIIGQGGRPASGA
jgi:bifunctional UDP-N-acetylglucosamine pyrophosphorylase/glucosamine-1-phosphate N-acetyltransferase